MRGRRVVESQLASQVESLARVYLIPTAWKLLGATALWVIGGWVIRLVRAAFGGFLLLPDFDAAPTSYGQASAAILLEVLLFIAVLRVLGIETTPFAAPPA